jgi:sirohydrochlorin ferrochelatase
MIDDAILQSLGLRRDQLGVILVDHGSRLAESNELLDDVAVNFARHAGLEIVEPAHMELAEPSMETAFDRAVSRGAKFVVVFPYFLGPGRHWKHDIPRLAAAAAAGHPGVQYIVTAPLGIHPRMNTIIEDRVSDGLTAWMGQHQPPDSPS